MTPKSLTVNAVSCGIRVTGEACTDAAALPFAAAVGRVPLSAEVGRAVRHMTEHYACPITLREIADLTNCSPSRIIRAFRRELGTTPHAWLIRLRVSVATALLQRGERIASVASEVGFVDQTHFTRHFKRLHGETPGRFLGRQSYRGKKGPGQRTVERGSGMTDPCQFRTADACQ